MTCIVGVEAGGKVYIGGDSAGTAGFQQTIRADVKVFRRGPYLLGFTSSFRMGQLLRYSLTAPKPAGDLDRHMSTTFIDAVRDCLTEGGWLSKENGREEGGTFLVGVHGRLYTIEADHQVARSHDDYVAVGCGDDIALGSLYTSAGLKPKVRVRAALEAAAYHSAGVAGPFVVRSA